MAHSGITEAAFIAKLCSLNGTDLGVRLDFFFLNMLAECVALGWPAPQNKRTRNHFLQVKALCVYVCAYVCVHFMMNFMPVG